MTSPNMVVIMFWHLLLVSFQFKTELTLTLHTKWHTFVCVWAQSKAMGDAECSLFTPVAVAVSDSIQSAHMYHESLWSEALNHSSIYSINSFLLWHLIIDLPLRSQRFLPTPLPRTELPSTYWEVYFGCATPSTDYVSDSEVVELNIFLHREIKWGGSCWD